MACSSSCPSQDHDSYGACLRSKGIQIDRHALVHYGADRDKDKRLTRYADARSQGLQPKSTQWKDVRATFETGGVAHTPIGVQETPKPSSVLTEGF